MAYMPPSATEWQPPTATPAKSYAQKRREILAGKAAAEAEAYQAQADAVRGVVNTLPEVGGTLGSLAGPVGAGIGAGLGQTGVEIAKAGVGEGFDPGAIGKRAGFALAGGAIGQGAGKLLGKAGGIVTGTLRRKAVEKAANEYATATQMGVTTPTISLTQGIPKLLQRAGAAGQREVDHILTEYRNFMSNKGSDLTPNDLHQIRQVMDDIAKPFYNATGKFKPPPEPAVAAQVRFAKQVADNAREELRRLVPSATKYERQASRYITAAKFIPVGNPGSIGHLGARTAVAGTLGAMGGGVPGGIAATMGTALLAQPQVAMLLGKLLESPALGTVLSQAGRVAGTEAAR